jgi:hypothetical protein
MLFLCLCVSGVSFGASQTIYWTGKGLDNLWTNPGNWDPCIPYNPGLDNYAAIEGTGNDPLVNMDVPNTYGGVRIGYHDPNAVSFTMTSGSLYCSDYFCQAYSAAVTQSTVNISGGLLSASNGLYIPREGSCTFNMTGGELYTALTRMGYIAGHGTGMNSMSGGNLYSPSYVTLGYESGQLITFNVSGTAYIETNALVVGRHGPGTLNMTGGEINAANKVWVGEFGGQGIWNMSGGWLHTPGYISVGYGDYSGTDVINMTGGQVDCNDLIVGDKANGQINLAGGVINVNYQNKLGALRIDANGGRGVLNLCGGTMNWKYGNHTADANLLNYIAHGGVAAYEGSGRLLCTYDSPNNTTVLKADNTASYPVPDNGAPDVYYTLNTIEWQNPFPGQTVYCDVLFGTDPTMASAVKIIDHQAVTSAAVTLNTGTVYYWRVDTYDPNPPGAKTVGVLWSFSVTYQSCHLTVGAGDLNGDCKINFKDFAIVAGNWLNSD